MNYVRFMGKDELKKYLNGENLQNKTIWKEYGRDSDSVGFCFFDDSVDPEERLRYLTGVVDISTVAVFERISPDPMRKSIGIYRDPENDTVENWLAFLLGEDIKIMEVPEYSTEEYSEKTMRLLKTGTPIVSLAGDYSIKWNVENEKHIERKTYENSNRTENRT